VLVEAFSLNRIDGLLATFGITGYKPLRRDRRERLEALRTPEGTELPANAKAKIVRILDRLDLVMTQIAALEEGSERHHDAAAAWAAAEVVAGEAVMAVAIVVQASGHRD
jgi:hypothetical protein